MAHRLAWLFTHGVWPDDQIDHIDGNKLNNAISNLRPAVTSQNKANGRYRNSVSGLKGITLAGNRWRAQIVKDQAHHHLGYFDTKEQAHEAYQAAARRLHGEFARP